MFAENPSSATVSKFAMAEFTDHQAGSTVILYALGYAGAISTKHLTMKI
jgi:hypothetical protein